MTTTDERNPPAAASLQSPAAPTLERPPRRPSFRSVFWFLVRLAVGVGLVAYLVESGVIDVRGFRNLVIAWPISLAALALMFLDIALMALRLSWLFRPPRLHLSVANSLELTLVSSFFATFLPGAAGGDLAKLYYASAGNKGRRAEIITVLIFDRFVGLFSILVLPLLFAPFFLPLIQSVAILRGLLLASLAAAAALLAGFLLCLFYPAVIRRMIGPLRGFPSVTKLAERVVTTIATYRESIGTLLAALGLSLLANLTLIVVTALAVYILHPESMSAKMCLVIPLGDIANNIPITPGGLGVGESAYNLLFKSVGLRGGAEALLSWRLWRATAGLIGLFLYLRGPARSVFAGGSSTEESTTRQ